MDSKLLNAAEKWIAAIEKEGARHVSALAKQVGSKKDMKLSDGPWLGHLMALRKDFRGIDCVEAYMGKIDFDGLYRKQAKGRTKIIEAYYSKKNGKDKYETMVPELAKAYLFEGYPPDLWKVLDDLNDQAKRGKFSKKAIRAFESVRDWKSSMEAGYKEYESLWKKWEGPKR